MTDKVRVNYREANYPLSRLVIRGSFNVNLPFTDPVIVNRVRNRIFGFLKCQIRKGLLPGSYKIKTEVRGITRKKIVVTRMA
jgi:hypothetical protein